ncbi:MAG: hypothetical protein D3924_03170 [Candidatus Electrothrix sp. AR4]|nr:hypothetical protein [Candidatus Electrothrix sp. AR4]
MTTDRSSFQVKGTQVNLVTTIGRTNSPPARFLAKGVCWLPLPLGANPGQSPYGDYMTNNYKRVWQADLDRMRSMGVNTVRCFAGSDFASSQWRDMMDYAWNCGTDPIYFFWYSFIPSGDLVNNQDKYAQVYKIITQNTAAHPATIGYCIGNELNHRQAGFAGAINKIAGAIKSIVGVSGNKLVTTALEDDGATLPSVSELLNSNTSLDIISLNVYRGREFGGSLGNANNIFTNYRTVAGTKALPLLLSEWGTPYSTRQDPDNSTKISTNVNDKLVGLDEVQFNPDSSSITSQAAFIEAQWNNILQEYNSTESVGFGGTLFLWSDNWSSVSPDDQHNADAGGYSGGAFAGGYWDNEWFGIYALCRSSEATYNAVPGKSGYYTCPAKLNTYEPQPRPVVTTLTKLWKKS